MISRTRIRIRVPGHAEPSPADAAILQRLMAVESTQARLDFLG
jgi:hypothetical protein